MDILNNWFSSQGFMPHGHCFLWIPSILWMSVISDAASVVLGAGYGLWNVAAHSRIPNGAVLLILFGVMVFLVGLVSEQISALRFEERQ